MHAVWFHDVQYVKPLNRPGFAGGFSGARGCETAVAEDAAVPTNLGSYLSEFDGLIVVFDMSAAQFGHR